MTFCAGSAERADARTLDGGLARGKGRRGRLTVGQDVGVAVAVGIGAVVSGFTAIGRAGLGGYGPEAGSDGVAGGLGGGFEILAELGGRAGGGSVGGGIAQCHGARKGVGEGSALTPGARCYDGPFIEDPDSGRDSGGVGAVDADGEGVASVGDFGG